MNRNQITLDQLPAGDKTSVIMLTSDEATRRHMFDLGVVSGTEIEPLYKSPLGNLVAYLVRGAVITLRPDVSKKVVASVS